jgi:3-hydroxyacyl-[acyl-carrier-protein] dehydratase
MPGVDYTWRAPADHPALAGHFPERPIMPGVVLLDQAILFAERLLGYQVAAWQIGSAKFFSPVAPGELLVFALNIGERGVIAIDVRGAGRKVAACNLQATSA